MMTKETLSTINSIRYIIETVAVAFLIWIASTIWELKADVNILDERQKQIIELKEEIKELRKDIKQNRELLIKLNR